MFRKLNLYVNNFENILLKTKCKNIPYKDTYKIIYYLKIKTVILSAYKQTRVERRKIKPL